MINRWSGYVAFAFIVAIAFESTCPPSLPNDVIPNLDKIAHFFAFGIVAWFVAVGLSCRKILHGSNAFIMVGSFFFTSLLALGNEWIQSFNPSRVVSLDDIAAGMAGAASFMLVWRMILMRKN